MRYKSLTRDQSNNHIQDVLVVSYLANTIRTQIDLSNRLATATLITPGAGDLGGEDGKKEGGDRQQKRGGDRGERGERGQRGNRPPREREQQ
jgi:translation initiation factor 3 subunit F